MRHNCLFKIFLPSFQASFRIYSQETGLSILSLIQSLLQKTQQSLRLQYNFFLTSFQIKKSVRNMVTFVNRKSVAVRKHIPKILFYFHKMKAFEGSLVRSRRVIQPHKSYHFISQLNSIVRFIYDYGFFQFMIEIKNQEGHLRLKPEKQLEIYIQRNLELHQLHE